MRKKVDGTRGMPSSVPPVSDVSGLSLWLQQLRAGIQQVVERQSEFASALASISNDAVEAAGDAGGSVSIGGGDGVGTLEVSDDSYWYIVGSYPGGDRWLTIE